MKRIFNLLLLLISIHGYSQNMVLATNWKLIPIPLNSTQKLYFWSADSGYAYGIGSDNNVQLFRTMNGGMTWTEVLKINGAVINKTNNNFVNFKYSYIKYQAACLRSKNEFAVAFTDTIGFLQYYKTKDGGLNWQNYTSKDTLWANVNDMYFRNDTLIVVSGAAGFYFNQVIISTDNGKSFSNFMNGCLNNRIYSSKDDKLITITGSNSCSNSGYYDTYARQFDLADFSQVKTKAFTYYHMTDKDSGFAFEDNGYWGIDRVPVNDIPKDSFYRSGHRDGYDIYENFSNGRGLPEAFIFNTKTAIFLRGHSVFTMDGAIFNGGFLVMPDSIITSCIFYGDANTGYIGTNGKYLLKTTKGIELVNGISEGDKNTIRFKLYPNPSSNVLNIEFTEAVKFSFTISNALGNKSGVDTLSHSSTGIRSNANSGQNFFRLYPNPATNILNIEFAEDVEFSFSISNALGQTIIKGSGNGRELIDISSLGKGVYFVCVRDNENNFRVQKLIKK